MGPTIIFIRSVESEQIVKIIVGLSNGQEYELSKSEFYTNAKDTASFINMKFLQANFLPAKDGILIMPKQVVYIREEE